LDVIRIVSANNVLRNDRVVESSDVRVSVRGRHILHLDIGLGLVFADGEALAEDFSPAGWLVLG